MEIKTKFQVGDLIISRDHSHIGKVIAITIHVKSVTTITYHIMANGYASQVDEEKILSKIDIPDKAYYAAT